MNSKTGVAPLVCAICLNIVGVINVTELERMHDDNEVYICAYCEKNASEADVRMMLKHYNAHAWYELTQSLHTNPKAEWEYPVIDVYSCYGNPVRYVEVPRDTL